MRANCRLLVREIGQAVEVADVGFSWPFGGERVIVLLMRNLALGS